MTRTTRCAAIATAGLLIIGLAACGNSKSSSASGGSAGATGANGKFAVSASSCPADATQPLAAGAPIKIGTSQPLSGPLAVAGAANVAGLTAYFQKINDAGGVDGHKIELVSKDDAFDAGRATTNAQAFTGQEKVFATVAQVGTPQITATAPIYASACVPQLWTITTGAQFSDPTKSPWTINGIPPAPVEAKAIVDYIAKKKPSAKVVELMDSEALAQDFHSALPALAQKAGLKVQSAQTIPAGATNIDAQLSAAVASSPDAIVLEALPNYVPGFLTGLARANFKGLVVLNSSANAASQWVTPADPAGQGAVVPLFRKDPADPQWANDPAMKEYLADMTAAGQEKMAPLGNALDGYGWGQLLVQNLKDAAKADGGLTRANVMTAAWNMNISRPLMLHPDESTNGTADPVIEEAGQIGVYSTENKGWTADGDWDYSGKSADLIGQK